MHWSHGSWHAGGSGTDCPECAVADAAEELNYAVSKVAHQVLRRAYLDAQTTEFGWARFPDMAESDWNRVVARVADMLVAVESDFDIIAYHEQEHTCVGYDEAYAFLASRAKDEEA